jgi:hypothetical protein
MHTSLIVAWFFSSRPNKKCHPRISNFFKTGQKTPPNAENLHFLTPFLNFFEKIYQLFSAGYYPAYTRAAKCPKLKICVIVK